MTGNWEVYKVLRNGIDRTVTFSRWVEKTSDSTRVHDLELVTITENGELFGTELLRSSDVVKRINQLIDLGYVG